MSSRSRSRFSDDARGVAALYRRDLDGTTALAAAASVLFAVVTSLALWALVILVLSVTIG